jgi:hypothetical protein
MTVRYRVVSIPRAPRSSVAMQSFTRCNPSTRCPGLMIRSSRSTSRRSRLYRASARADAPPGRCRGARQSGGAQAARGPSGHRTGRRPGPLSAALQSGLQPHRTRLRQTKRFLRAMRPRTFEQVCDLIAAALGLFTSDECANYARYCGHPPRPSPSTGEGTRQRAQRRECTPMTTRSFALARLRRHREAFFNPRLPERCLAGDGPGRLIAVEVEA